MCQRCYHSTYSTRTPWPDDDGWPQVGRSDMKWHNWAFSDYFVTDCQSHFLDGSPERAEEDGFLRVYQIYSLVDVVDRVATDSSIQSQGLRIGKSVFLTCPEWMKQASMEQDRHAKRFVHARANFELCRIRLTLTLGSPIQSVFSWAFILDGFLSFLISLLDFGPNKMKVAIVVSRYITDMLLVCP